MAISFIPGISLPSPGTCVSCGSTGIDSIDSGRTDPFYGALLICVSCIRWAATQYPQMGLMRASDHQRAVANMTTEIEKVDNIEPTLDQLSSDFSAAIDRARNGFHHIPIRDEDAADILKPKPDRIEAGTEDTPQRSESIPVPSFFS